MVGNAFSGCLGIVMVPFRGQVAMLDEVARINVALKHFVELGFFSVSCYGCAAVGM